MTTKQAEAQGLVFTGCWVRDYERDQAKEEAKRIREKYKCRAVLVNEGSGVAVYADQKHEDLQRMESLECRLKFYPCKRDNFLKQIAELEEEEKKVRKEIMEIKNCYGIGGQDE